MSVDIGTRGRERNSSSGTSSSLNHDRQEGPSLNGNGYHQNYNGNGRQPDDQVTYFFPVDGQGSLESSPRRSPEKHRTHGNILSPTKRSKDRGSTRDLVRLLIAERDSKDALRALGKTTDRLQEETQRANELEKRLTESNEKWKLVNQARLTAQSEATRLNEELRLYKIQLETAQQEITRANELISQSDKERALAEENAEKATRMVNKLKEEQLVRQAREDGRRQGREEGRREGKRIGYHEALDYAYARARDDVMRRLDAYLIRNGLATDETLEEVEEELDGMGPEDEQDIRDREIEQEMEERRRLEPSSAPRPDMPVGRGEEERRQEIPPPRPVMQTTQAMPMPEAEMRYARTSPVSNKPKRTGTFLDRFRRRQRVPAYGEEDRNVEVNRGAPDVASFVDNAPPRTLATPVISSAPYASQSGQRSRSTLAMPEPDFNPDPSTVRPISNYNTPRTPSHPRVDIPPDNFIPVQDENGNMSIPPPHEMSRPPPTPGAGNSPAQENVALPSGREPMSRDFYYENNQQPPPPPSTVPRYQRSVAGDSVISTATSNLSILTPPGGTRHHASGSRLSAIHESSPFGERSSLRDGDAASIRRPNSRNSERIIPGNDPLGRMGDYAGDPGMNDHQFAEHRTRVRDELRDPDLGPRGQMPPYSPRSVRSGSSFAHGPRRPSVLTTPAPLGEMHMIDPENPYVRPRINSGASDRTGFTNPRSQRGGGVAGSGINRGGQSEMPAPEIQIEPPSRSESQRSTRVVMPQATVVLPDNSTGMNNSYVRSASRGPDFEYRNPLSNSPDPSFVQQAATPSPMMPVPPPPVPSTPGMPPGFVPTGITTPMLPSAEPPMLPPGEAFPSGFVPMSASVSNAPLPAMPEPVIPHSPAPGSFAGPLPVLPGGPSQVRAPSPRFGNTGSDGNGWGNGSNWDNQSQTRSPRPMGFGDAPRPVSPRPPGVARSGRSGSIGTQQSSFNPALNSALPMPTVRRTDGTVTPIIPQQTSSFGTSSPNLGAAGLARSNTFSGNTAYVRPISPAPRRTAATFDFGAPDPSGVQLPPSRNPSFGRARTGSSASGSGSGFGKPVMPTPQVPNFGAPLGPSSMSSAGLQRAPSPRPSLGGANEYYDPAAVPIPPTAAPSRAGVPRTNSYGSAAAGSRTPGPGLSRSLSMNEARSPRPGNIGFPDARTAPYGAPPVDPSGPVIPDISGLPPAGLSTPYSRRMNLDPENVQMPTSNRNSAYTFTTTPGRGREPVLPGDPYLPPPSPAFSARSGGSRPRRAREATLGGDSPRSSRVYPRTPHARPAGIDDQLPAPGEFGAQPMERPVYGFTNRDPGLRRPSSRASMTSNKSHKSFDASSYVDPAILASGESRLLNNKKSTGSGFGGSFSGWD